MDDSQSSTAVLDSPIKVSTFNVRGFMNKKKRVSILRRFKIDKLDIVGLQESHIVDDNIMKELSLQWGGKIHFSNGTNRSKGLITLFSSKYNDIDVKLLYKSDRIIISCLPFASTNLIIINVYSPCEHSNKSAFLDHLLAIIQSHVQIEDQGSMICLGDFNIAYSDTDVVSGNPHASDIRQGFNTFVRTIGFVDSWRMLHPSEKDFTWSRAVPSCARRLDYIFVGESIACYIKDSIIKTIGFSDHRLVTTTLEFSSFKHGQGLYKFNTSLINDKNYCKMIVDIINQTICEYQSLDPHLRWEMIKNNIRETSQQYSRFQARKKEDNIKSLHSQLQLLEKSLTDNANDVQLWNEIATIKRELEIIELFKTKGAQIRSRLKYIEEGESVTNISYP